MKKLLSILSAVVLTSSASTSIIACGSQEKPTENNNLKTIITNTNLNTIYISRKDAPNKDEVLAAIKEKNAAAYELNVNDFNFKTPPTEKSATIVTVPTSRFKGEVSVTYTSSSFELMKGTVGAIKSVTTTSDGTIYAGGNDGDIYKSTGGANNFIPLKSLSDIEIRSLTTDIYDNVYGANGKIYKKQKTQDSFTQMTMSDDADKVTKWEAVATNKVYVYAASAEGVFRSDKIAGATGATLFAKKMNDQGRVKPENIKSLATSSKDQAVYAGSSGGTVYKNDGSDEIFNQMTGAAGSIESLAVAVDGTVYAGSDNGIVYKSSGGNTSFISLTGTKANITIASLTTDKDGNVYAGDSDGGMYKLENGTTNFTPMLGIVNTVYALTTATNSNMYIATIKGVYQY